MTVCVSNVSNVSSWLIDWCKTLILYLNFMFLTLWDSWEIDILKTYIPFVMWWFDDTWNLSNDARWRRHDVELLQKIFYFDCWTSLIKRTSKFHIQNMIEFQCNDEVQTNSRFWCLNQTYTKPRFVSNDGWSYNVIRRPWSEMRNVLVSICLEWLSMKLSLTILRW